MVSSSTGKGSQSKISVECKSRLDARARERAAGAPRGEVFSSRRGKVCYIRDKAVLVARCASLGSSGRPSWVRSSLASCPRGSCTRPPRRRRRWATPAAGGRTCARGGGQGGCERAGVQGGASRRLHGTGNVQARRCPNACAVPHRRAACAAGWVLQGGHGRGALTARPCVSAPTSTRSARGPTWGAGAF